MNKNVKLLLIENVEGQGIVGDVVNVRVGFARNFLLPRNLATEPSEELVKQLAGKRADAQKMLAEQRKQRETLVSKLEGVEITLVRPCNDMGILYGAITQQEVATQLNEKGFAVKPRDIRIPQAIKRVDNYDIHIKLDSDLDATIKLHVQADRKLDKLEEDAPAAKGDRAEGQPEGTEGGEQGDGERRQRKPKGGESEGRKKSALDMALEAAAADGAKKKGGASADAGDKKSKKDAGEKKSKAKA